MSLSFWTPEVQRRKKLKSTIKKLEHKNNSPILCAYVPEVWESNPFQLSEGLDQERQVKRFSQFWSPQECVIFSALRPEDVSYCKSTKLSVFSYTDISYMDSNIGYIYTAIVIKRKKASVPLIEAQQIMTSLHKGFWGRYCLLLAALPLRKAILVHV